MNLTLKRILWAGIAGLFVSAVALPATAQFVSTDRLNGIEAGLAVKAPVKAVSSAALTLYGEQTVGGVAVVAGDRVLVKDQADATENGIYVVSTTEWARAADFDGNRDVTQGTLVVFYNDGAPGVFYQVTSAGPITIGTSAIQFQALDDPSITYSQTAAEVAAGVVPVNASYPELDINRYGTNTTPGTTVMTTAFQNLAAVATAKGGGTVVLHHENYLVWSGSSPNLMYFTGTEGLTVEGNGATLVSGRTNGPGVFAITLDGTDHTIVRNLTMVGSNTTLTQATGEGEVNLLNGATDTVLENLHSENANTLVECGSSSETPPLTGRISGIEVINLLAENTYYGLGCTGNGDNVHGNIRGVNTGRVYFPWNVRDHDIWIEGQQQGPFTDVLMKCYGYTSGLSELRNIRVHYHTDGKSSAAEANTAADSMIKLELQLHDAGTHCEVGNIDVTFDVNVPSGNGGAQTNRIFDITKYDTASLQDGTGRGHVIDNVHVRGVIRNFQNSGALTNALVPIMVFDNSTDGGGMHQFNWTGDFARDIEIGPIVIHDTTVSPGMAGVFVNGQPAVSGKPFVNVHDLDLSNLLFSRTNWSGSIRYRENAISASSYTPLISYTPSWTASSSNPSLGNGTLSGFYAKDGNRVTVTIVLSAGSTTTFGSGQWYFSLPSTPNSTAALHGSGYALVAGTRYPVSTESTTDGSGRVQLVSTGGFVTSAVPGAWTTGNNLQFTVTYFE